MNKTKFNAADKKRAVLSWSGGDIVEVDDIVDDIIDVIIDDVVDEVVDEVVDDVVDDMVDDVVDDIVVLSSQIQRGHSM